jgi:hypothetical protein
MEDRWIKITEKSLPPQGTHVWIYNKLERSKPKLRYIYDKAWMYVGLWWAPLEHPPLPQ